MVGSAVIVGFCLAGVLRRTVARVMFGAAGAVTLTRSLTPVSVAHPALASASSPALSSSVVVDFLGSLIEASAEKSA